MILQPDNNAHALPRVEILGLDPKMTKRRVAYYVR